MGCDGGTIPRRDELVRTKQKPEQVDKNAETVAKWKHCAISQEPLRKPIVACELGRLYNKEAVIEQLLNKDSICEKADHLNKLSDVKELKLTEKTGYEDKNNKGDGVYIDVYDSRFICPVTALDMNGTQRFYFIWGCGCVMSERAIKEVKSETCHKCGKQFSDDDLIIMNGSEEEILELQTRMIERRRTAKLLKKKKKSEATVASCSSEKKIKLESEDLDYHKIKSNGTEKIKSNGTESSKTVKAESSKKKIDKSQSSRSKIVELPEKAQNGYSIAEDPTASDAFKSLFTTHKTAKNQEKAHWVTHNPLYF